MHCAFCLRNNGDGVGEADSLWLEREPTRMEIWEDIQRRELGEFRELVFCGYGEPTYRLHDILWVCDRVREISPISIRMDTNGHGSLIWGKDITPLFAGRFDTVSISLNAPDKETYNARCEPDFDDGYEAMLQFTRDVRKYVPRVVMTVVDCVAPEEIEQCRQICEEIGAQYRIREYEA
jgi:TatD family-associated radical SAM protein